jgi:hypothetical protein
MSELAKSARAKMKEKIGRMLNDPHKKVDASSWEPTEALNTEAKTGLRPITKRQYKRGGKVHGEEAVKHAGRKARKSGGRAGSKPITADTLTARDVKEGNAAEHGRPHIGGYKRGGRAKYQVGGNTVADDFARIQAKIDARKAQQDQDVLDAARRGNVSSRPLDRLPPTGEYGGGPDLVRRTGRKSGGRTGKMDGGMMDPRTLAAANLAASASRSGVSPSRMGFQARGAQPLPMSGMKKGGKASSDASQDKKLIKKAFRQHETAEHGGKHVPLHLKKGGEAKKCSGGRMGRAAGGRMSPDEMEAANRVMRVSKTKPDALDEELFDKSAREKYMQKKYNEYKAKKLPVLDLTEDMIARKRGGKAEKWIHKAIKHPGALHKSLHVPAGEKIPAKKLAKAAHSDNPKLAKRAHLAQTLKKLHKKDGGMSEGGGNYTGGTRPTGGRIARKSGGKAGKGKTNINIVIGTGRHGMEQQAPGQIMGGPAPARPVPVPPPGMGMPMGMPPGMPMGAPGGMPPAPPMGGPGVPALPRKSGGKVGHRSYKSYKDMDAGAGSGFGRLEKAEIQKRK